MVYRFTRLRIWYQNFIHRNVSINGTYIGIYLFYKKNYLKYLLNEPVKNQDCDKYNNMNNIQHVTDEVAGKMLL